MAVVGPGTTYRKEFTHWYSGAAIIAAAQTDHVALWVPGAMVSSFEEPMLRAGSVTGVKVSLVAAVTVGSLTI